MIFVSSLEFCLFKKYFQRNIEAGLFAHYAITLGSKVWDSSFEIIKCFML